MSQTARSSSREHLLASAGRVLRHRGLHGIRVREIAAAAGMSPGAVMYHYRSLEELLLALHEDAQERYLALRRTAVEGGRGDAWSRLLAGFTSGLPPYSDGDLIGLLYEMHGLTRQSPRHAVLLTDLWEAEFALTLALIEDGVREGLFTVSAPAAAARSLLALEDGLALHLVSANGALDASLATETFTAAARAILGVSGPTDARAEEPVAQARR